MVRFMNAIWHYSHSVHFNVKTAHTLSLFIDYYFTVAHECGTDGHGEGAGLWMGVGLVGGGVRGVGQGWVNYSNTN